MTKHRLIAFRLHMNRTVLKSLSILLGLFLSIGIGKEPLARYMSHSQMLGKVESGGGPIFKVVLEC